MTKEIKVKAQKKKKNASLDKRKARAGWWFVLPFVLSFVLIYLPIVGDSLRYSFSELIQETGKPAQFKWVGFVNYNDALFGTSSTAGTGGTFIQILFEGIGNMIFDIPMILIFSLFMAVLLNQKMAGRAAFRAILFVPVIIATGIMEVGEVPIDSTGGTGVNDGSGESTSDQLVSMFDMQQLFSGMVVGEGLVKYVVTAINNIFNIVNHSGVQILIFLAGLQSISPAIYESVQIDGASAWETFWKITFPMISPMILVNAVYTIIDSFTMESNVIMLFIDEVNKGGHMVQGAAMSWMYFLLVIGIIAIVGAIFGAYIFYQRRD